MVTAEQLDELEELAKAATPGPWKCDDGNVFSVPLGRPRRDALDRHWSTHPPTDVGPIPDEDGFLFGGQQNDNYGANSELVVAMRNSLDALAAELRAHREREASGGWIAVSERMPEVATDGEDAGCSEWVNVYAPRRGADMASWDGERWYWRAEGYAIPSEVTHWQPLPAQPAVKEPTR
jgi:hypothetical protein